MASFHFLLGLDFLPLIKYCPPLPQLGDESRGFVFVSSLNHLYVPIKWKLRYWHHVYGNLSACIWVNKACGDFNNENYQHSNLHVEMKLDRLGHVCLFPPCCIQKHLTSCCLSALDMLFIIGHDKSIIASYTLYSRELNIRAFEMKVAS